MSNRRKSTPKNKWLPLITAAIFICILAALVYNKYAPSFQSYTGNSKTSDSPSGYDFIPGRDFVLPASNKQDKVVRHMAFSLSYDEEHEQARWVAYELKAEYFTQSRKTKRTDDFRPDPDIRTGSAQLEDYRRSGYDRGHLLPAAAMAWSPQAMSETFLLSNISPQNHSFNEGIWAELEKNERAWAKVNGQVYCVTGPVLEGIMPAIGKNKVSVPPAFYKVVMDVSAPDMKAIGFIIPNESGRESFWKYAVPIDEVERRTGLDFFPTLPNDLENKLENQTDPKLWYTREASHPR